MRSLIDMLNRAMPANKKAMLGTKLADLSVQLNLLRADLARVYLQNQFILTAPTLVIKAGGGTVPKSSTAFSVLTAGVVQSKSANTDMSVLVGTLADTKTAAWAFEIDAAGTITTLSKTADVATPALAVAALAAVSANKVRIGYVVVTNASGDPFTGGTTALDATGITTTYVSNSVTSPILAAAVTELT